MTDIVLTPVTTGYNLNSINSNFTKLQNIINDDVLHLEGGSNTLRQDLDFNGHAALNLRLGGLNAPILPNDAVRLVDLTTEAGIRQASDSSLQTQINNIIVNQNSGTIGYATLAALNADLNKPDGTVAYVTNDPTAANNTTYRKSGATGTGSWVQAVDRITNLTTSLSASSGSNTIGFISRLTGGVSRTLQDKLNESTSLQDFMSVSQINSARSRDGLVDHTSAFQAAIASGVQALYIPDGVYNLTSGITITDKAFRIFGNGNGASELRYSGTGTFITFNSTNILSPFVMRDLTLTTTSTLGGTALACNWAETFNGRVDVKCTIENVQVRGVNEGTQGWAYGFTFNQGVNVFISHCGLTGRDTGGSGSTSQASKTASTCAITFTGGVYPCELKLTDNIINNWDQGLTTTGAVEGVYVASTTFGQCRLGLNLSATTFSPGIGGGSALFRPGLLVHDCHMDVYQVAVYNNGMIQGSIHDNLFYANSTGTQSAALIQMINTGDIHIHNNVLVPFNTNFLPTAISVSSANGVYIYDNVLSAGSWATGISIASGVTNVRYGRNKFNGSYSVTDVNDAGTRTTAGRRGVLMSVSTNPSIANNATTPVSWDTIQYDTDGFWSAGAPASLVIPVGSGIKRVKLSASGVFQPNGTGTRDAHIRKNSVDNYPGSPNPQFPATPPAASNVFWSFETAIIPCTGGDVFDLAVFQNSGAPLGMIAARTWLALEVCD